MELERPISPANTVQKEVNKVGIYFRKSWSDLSAEGGRSADIISKLMLKGIGDSRKVNSFLHTG